MLEFSVTSMVLNKIKKILPFIGIAIFIYLVIRLDITNIIKQIRSANLAYLFLAVLLLCVYVLFQTTKWYVIARAQKIKVPFKKAIKINIITNFYGFVTPARLGSAMRAGYLKKYTGGIGKGLSNFVIDKVLDLGSIFILAIAMGFIFRNKLGFISSNSLYILIALFLLFVLLFLVFYKKSATKFLLRVVYRKLIPESMKAKTKTTFESFYKDIPSLSVVFIAFIINLLTWTINYLISYLIGLSLGIELNFIYYLAIYPIATLIAQIPITISGLGTREFTLIGLFSLFGAEPVKVFSMSLVSMILIDVVPSLAAIILLIGKRKNK